MKMKSAGVRSELHDGDQSIVFFLGGEIDHHSAKYLRERIDAEIYFFRPKKVTLELSEVSFMDSAGLGLILGRYTRSKDLGAVFELLDPTDEIVRIVSMAGADRLFSIKKSADVTVEKEKEKDKEKDKDKDKKKKERMIAKKQMEVTEK